MSENNEQDKFKKESLKIIPELQEKMVSNWISGLLKRPKQVLYSIYEPKKPWSEKEILSAILILFLEAFIFIYTLESFFYFEMNILITLLQVGILLLVITLPLAMISKNSKPTIIWHAKILVIPAIICLIILIFVFPLGFVEITMLVQIMFFIVLLAFFVAWALLWKFYSYIKLFQKEGKPHIGKAMRFSFYDEIVLIGFLLYIFLFYFLQYVIIYF